MAANASESAVIWALIVVAINWLVYIPIGLYFSVQYYQKRNQAYIRNRRYANALFMVASLIVFLSIARPFNLVGFVSSGIVTNQYVEIAISNLGYLCVMLVLARLWLLYFDYQRNKQLLKYKWKSRLIVSQPNSPIATPSSVENSGLNFSQMFSFRSESSKSRRTASITNNKIEYSIPWTMKYHKTVGNSSKVHIGCFCFYLFITIANLISLYVNEVMFNIIQVFWSSIIVTLFIIGFYRIQQCRDEINIRHEFGLSFIVLGSWSIFYFSGVVPWFELGDERRLLLMTSSMSLVGFLQIMIETAMPLYNLKKRLKSNDEMASNFIARKISITKYFGGKERKRKNNRQDREGSMSTTKSEINTLTLNEILSNTTGFELFTNHLVSEYSIENMLFLLEIEMIKDEIIKSELIESENTGFRVPIDKTVKDLKKSQTFCSNFNECIWSICQIIDSYVNDRGEFSINLSSRCRDNILTNLSWIKEYCIAQSSGIDGNSDDIKMIIINDDNDAEPKSNPSLKLNAPSSSKESSNNLVLSMKNQIRNNSNSNGNDNNSFTINQLSGNDSDKAVIGLKTTKEERDKLKRIMIEFDAAIKEIYRLLRTDSLYRFLRSEQYYKFYKQFGDRILSERRNSVNNAIDASLNLRGAKSLSIK